MPTVMGGSPQYDNLRKARYDKAVEIFTQLYGKEALVEELL